MVRLSAMVCSISLNIVVLLCGIEIQGDRQVTLQVIVQTID